MDFLRDRGLCREGNLREHNQPTFLDSGEIGYIKEVSCRGFPGARGGRRGVGLERRMVLCEGWGVLFLKRGIYHRS